VALSLLGINRKSTAQILLQKNPNSSEVLSRPQTDIPFE
jgi:hypothetical protein